METTELKQTPKKQTKKPTRTTKPKAENLKQETVNSSVDIMNALSNLTPEALAQLVSLVQNSNHLETQNVAQTTREVEKPKRPTKAYLNTIRDKEVSVRNVTNGMVVFTSQKTGVTYKWMAKDDIELMTIAEVLTMHSQSAKFLTSPWVLVDDEDVMVALGLKDIQVQINALEDLDYLLEQPIDVIKNTLIPLPTTYKAQICDEIGAKILNQELRDIYVIRALEELFNKQFLF